MADNEEVKKPAIEEPDLMAPTIGEPDEGGEFEAPDLSGDGKKAPVEGDKREAAQDTGEVDYDKLSPEELRAQLKKERLDREKAEKDRNRLGFSVREMQEQLGFVTSQFAQEQAKIKKADLEKARDAELRDIDHLKESDIDAYAKEYDRILRKFYETSGDESRKLATNAEEANKASQVYKMVSAKITQDFPDVNDENSDLFKEAATILFSRYDKEEAAQLAKREPKVFYSIVSEAAGNLRIKNLQSGITDKGRESRVKGQGNLEAVRKPGGDGSKQLSPAQKKFCKDHGYNETEYAKYIGKGA